MGDRYDYNPYIGREIVKVFPHHGRFTGKITSFDPSSRLYLAVYSDGDSEEFSPEQLRKMLGEDVHPHQEPYIQGNVDRRHTYHVSQDSEAEVFQMFERVVVPALTRLGWSVEYGKLPNERFYIPPGLERINPRELRLGEDYFNSPVDVLRFVDNHHQLRNYCLSPEYHGRFISANASLGRSMHEVAHSRSSPRSHIYRNETTDHYHRGYGGHEPGYREGSYAGSNYDNRYHGESNIRNNHDSRNHQLYQGNYSADTRQSPYRGEPYSSFPQNNQMGRSGYGSSSSSFVYPRENYRDNDYNRYHSASSPRHSQPYTQHLQQEAGSRHPMDYHDRNESRMPVHRESSYHDQRSILSSHPNRNTYDYDRQRSDISSVSTLSYQYPSNSNPRSPGRPQRRNVMSMSAITRSPGYSWEKDDSNLSQEHQIKAEPKEEQSAPVRRGRLNMSDIISRSPRPVREDSNVSTTSFPWSSTVNDKDPSSSPPHSVERRDIHQRTIVNPSTEIKILQDHAIPDASMSHHRHPVGRISSVLSADTTLSIRHSNSPQISSQSHNNYSLKQEVPTKNSLLDRNAIESSTLESNASHSPFLLPRPRIESNTQVVYNSELDNFRRDHPGKQYINELHPTSGPHAKMYKELVIEFYKRYNPDNLQKVDEIMIRFRNREPILLRELRMKYCPLDLRTWEDLAKSWAKVEAAKERAAAKEMRLKALKCLLCSKQCRSKKELQVHMQRHEKQDTKTNDRISEEVAKLLDRLVRKVETNVFRGFQDEVNLKRKEAIRVQKDLVNQVNTKVDTWGYKDTHKNDSKKFKHVKINLGYSDEIESTKTLCLLPENDGNRYCTENIQDMWPLFCCTSCRRWYHVYCFRSNDSPNDPRKIRCTICEEKLPRKRSLNGRYIGGTPTLKFRRCASNIFVRDQVLRYSNKPRIEIIEDSMYAWKELSKENRSFWWRRLEKENEDVREDWVQAQMLQFLREDLLNEIPYGMQFPAMRKLFYQDLSKDMKLEEELKDAYSDTECKRDGCSSMSRISSEYCSDSCGVLVAEEELFHALDEGLYQRQSAKQTTKWKRNNKVHQELKLSQMMEMAREAGIVPKLTKEEVDEVARISTKRKETALQLSTIEEEIIKAKVLLKNERKRIHELTSLEDSGFRKQHGDESDFVDPMKVTASDSAPIHNVNMFPGGIGVDAYSVERGTWRSTTGLKSDRLKGLNESFSDIPESTIFPGSHVKDTGSHTASPPFQSREFDKPMQAIRFVYELSGKKSRNSLNKSKNHPCIYDDCISGEEIIDSESENERLVVQERKLPKLERKEDTSLGTEKETDDIINDELLVESSIDCITCGKVLDASNASSHMNLCYYLVNKISYEPLEVSRISVSLQDLRVQKSQLIQRICQLDREARKLLYKQRKLLLSSVVQAHHKTIQAKNSYGSNLTIDNQSDSCSKSVEDTYDIT